MITPSAAIPPTPAAPRVPPEQPEPETSFADVLSALNPLQYVPVVGTIYRAITGDIPPPAVRAIGSIAAGGLMGGPIGAAISAASQILQQVSGIDLDSVAHDAMVSVGMADEPPAAVPPTTAFAAYSQTLYTYGPGAGHA